MGSLLASSLALDYPVRAFICSSLALGHLVRHSLLLHLHARMRSPFFLPCGCDLSPEAPLHMLAALRPHPVYKAAAAGAEGAQERGDRGGGRAASSASRAEVTGGTADCHQTGAAVPVLAHAVPARGPAAFLHANIAHHLGEVSEVVMRDLQKLASILSKYLHQDEEVAGDPSKGQPTFQVWDCAGLAMQLILTACVSQHYRLTVKMHPL